MEYTLEQLIPIVSYLSDQFTSFESTSITYEKANQFLEAVLYCIGEIGKSGGKTEVSVNQLTAQEAYKTGYQMVVKKVKATLEVYNEMRLTFQSFRNKCLRETVVRGLPSFFRMYDPKFEPQNMILTLDYPILFHLGKDTGIDAICRYIEAVRTEQLFLLMFPETYVYKTVYRMIPDYQNAVENIASTILTDLLVHMLLNKKLEEAVYFDAEYNRLRKILTHYESSELEQIFNTMLQTFLKQIGLRESDAEPDEAKIAAITAYMEPALNDIAVRLLNAAENDSLVGLLNA